MRRKRTWWADNRSQLVYCLGEVCERGRGTERGKGPRGEGAKRWGFKGKSTAQIALVRHIAQLLVVMKSCEEGSPHIKANSLFLSDITSITPI